MSVMEVIKANLHNQLCNFHNSVVLCRNHVLILAFFVTCTFQYYSDRSPHKPRVYPDQKSCSSTFTFKELITAYQTLQGDRLS